MSSKLWRGTVITDQELEDGAVVTRGDQILWVGEADDLPPEHQDAVPQDVPEDALIMPGLIDVHCHGGGGASFPDSHSLQDVETAAFEHLRHGTTTLIASLVTADIPTLVERATLLADAVDAGIVAGIHYEGPFLSEARCGAQDPAYLIPATPAEAEALVVAARGKAVAITVAPEHCLDMEGRSAIQILVEGNILPSWGHTDGSLAQSNEAIEMGAELLDAQPEQVRGGKATVTHLFNGMPPMHHRAPGPLPAFLESAKSGIVYAEMINDGVHIDPLLVAEMVELLGKENCVFVTDAMAAAGMADGEYVLGPQAVRVEGGVARLAHGDAIAGGTSRLLDQLKVATRQGGISLPDAVFLASTQGAAVLGLTDRGQLAEGLRADLLVTDGNLDVARVVRGGEDVI